MNKCDTCGGENGAHSISCESLMSSGVDCPVIRSDQPAKADEVNEPPTRKEIMGRYAVTLLNLTSYMSNGGRWGRITSSGTDAELTDKAIAILESMLKEIKESIS